MQPRRPNQNPPQTGDVIQGTVEYKHYHVCYITGSTGLLEIYKTMAVYLWLKYECGETNSQTIGEVKVVDQRG